MSSFVDEFKNISESILALKDDSEDTTKMKNAVLFYVDFIDSAINSESMDKDCEALICEFNEIAKEYIDELTKN